MTKVQSAVLSVLIVTCGIVVCGAEGDSQVETVQHARQGNHLVGESSPYLLQHAYNPVEWYPWGEEAIEKARSEDKPIFLSIGYAACHWCHVMEHESFENEEIAGMLNDYFISIKVDREQRPDLDEIYMSFTQAMTGGGGWPMSVFLTPDLKPFYAGTYFPPEDRYGRPGFKRLITQIGSAYREDKNKLVASSEDIFSRVTSRLKSSLPVTALNRDMPEKAARSLMQGFDHVNGGFGNKPKFPHAIELSLFLRQYRRSGDQSFLDAAELALKAMARGGIYDHIGGGFARYSTDHRWLVPHFEKMLYDNGLLVPVYTEAFQLTQDEFYREVVRGTLDFLLREMTDKHGGFYSTLDADSEGEEGKFYVWTYREIRELLDDEAEPFIEYYNVTASGNFEGHNILNLTPTSDRVRSESGLDDFDEYLESCRRKLFELRYERVHPKTDDKILTSWNGLGLYALCSGYSITGDQRYLEAALANARFVEKELLSNGDLTHAYREGVHSPGLFLEDYAYYSRGLISLYEVSHDDHWIELAAALAGRAVTLFMDEGGTFYMRPDRQTDLIVRPKDETDSSTPSPGSIMIAVLLKLNRLTGDEKFLAAAEEGQRAISGQLAQNPGRMSSAALAIDYYFSDKIEIVIVGEGDVRDKMLIEVNQRYLPNKLVAVSGNGRSKLPLFEGRSSNSNDVVAYVCRNSVCQLPVSTVEELKAQLDGI